MPHELEPGLLRWNEVTSPCRYSRESSCQVHRWGWRVLAGCTQCKARASLDQLWSDFYKYIQISYRHFEMSLAGITQHCKIMYSQSIQAQTGFSRQWLWFSQSLRKQATVRLGISQSHLLRTKFRIALTQFAGSAFDNSIAKHRYHHHKEEVTGVHEVQVY